VVKAALALVVASVLVPLLQAPATARAADQVVGRVDDTVVGRLFQLGGVTLYQEKGPNPYLSHPHHELVDAPWTRVVNGKSRPVRDIPPTVGVGDIGRDASGRVVLTYYVDETKPDGPLLRRWFIYDVLRDRSRPIRGLNRDGCGVAILTIWRKRMVYQKACPDDRTAGLFSKIGKKVERIARYHSIVYMVQRGGSVAGIIEDGVGDLHVFRFMDGGVACVEEVPSGFGTGDGYWHPTGVWFSRGKLVWSMGAPGTAPNFALLAAKRSGACKALGPVGELPFTSETKSVSAMAVDADRLVYAGNAVIKAHRLPPKPSIDPPANDDFEHAQPLSTKLPYRILVRIGHATRQRGEPGVKGPYEQKPRTPTRTLWYAFRPAASGTAWVSSDNHTEAVFTGSKLRHLTPIPPGPLATEVHGEAGKTYWITVALDSEEPFYQPFYLTIGTAEPPPE
jgi:hypothetical protein